MILELIRFLIYSIIQILSYNASGKSQKSSSKKYDIEENGDDLYVKFGNGDTVEGLYTDKELTKPAFNDGTLFVYEWPHIALYDGDWTEKPLTSCRW